MAFEDTLRGLAEIERQLLRLLCQTRGGAAIEKAQRELVDYGWREQEHRIVFEALQKVRRQDWLSLREQLPAHATLAGFPDVDWDVYFQPLPVATDIGTLLRELKNAPRLS
jgi:hypothetical protein